MLVRLEQGLHSIRQKRVRGDISIFVIFVMFCFFFMLMFKFAIDNKRITVTKGMVDDSIVTSLLSACVYNTEEYGRSGQAIIYKTVTPIRLKVETMIPVPGKELPPPYEPLEDPEIFSPGHDEFLEQSYELFVKNLKNNLQLDDEMRSTVSGIDGAVKIDNFSVYNVYREFDELTGVETAFRVISYTRTDGGEWNVCAYNIDEVPLVFSSFDDTDVEITETSVAASLTFDVRVTERVDGLMDGVSDDELKSTVTYQRVVDIAIN